MANVVLVSLYDEFCIGMRQMAGYLKLIGHEVRIVHFKRYNKEPVAAAEANDEANRCPSMMVEVLAEGEVVNDFSYSFTPVEIKLFCKLIGSLKAEFVGFSVPSYHVKIAQFLSQNIKKELGLPVMWGGVHPTSKPHECFDAEGSVDYVCLGEGEYSTKQLLEAVAEKKDFANYPVPGYYIKLNGRIIENPHSTPENDLDKLGQPLYDENVEYIIDQDRVIHLENMYDSQLFWNHKMLTGRGCPFYCSFCIYSTLKRDFNELKRLRRRSPQHVITELLDAMQRMPQMEMVEFHDDIFVVQTKWLEEFAPLYIKHVHKPFWCYTFPNYVKRENLQILKDMGIAYLTMGVQSGSERILKEVYDRHTKIEVIKRAVNLIAEYGISPMYDFITNNPYETDEDRMATLDLMTSIPGDYGIHLPQLAWLPATTLTERGIEEGMTDKVDRKLYRFWNALYMMARYRIADRETILDLTKDEYLRQNPEVLWGAIKKAAVLDKKEKEFIKNKENVKVLENELIRVQSDLDSLKNRRAVKYSVNLVDSIKKLAGADNGH